MCRPPAPPWRFASQFAGSCGRLRGGSGCAMPQSWQSFAKVSGSFARATTAGALPNRVQRRAMAASRSCRSSNPVPQTIPAGSRERARLSSAALTVSERMPRARPWSRRIWASAAAAHIRLAQGLARGMRSDTVIAALESLARSREPAGIVCGTGFEDRQDLLAILARRWTLFGNAPAVVARAKDPLTFAKLCQDCGVAYPNTSLSRPQDLENWLAKRQGGAGGRHIR